jgi:hypothetical protein
MIYLHFITKYFSHSIFCCIFSILCRLSLVTFNIQNFSDGIYLKYFFSTFSQWISFPFVDIILHEILSIELTKFLAADSVPDKIS